MKLEEIVKALSDRNLKEVARRIDGISYQTVTRIAYGRGENPSYESIKKITEYLEKNP